MKYIDFIEQIHSSTKRDYIKRVTEKSKAKCAVVAKKFDVDFFDGERCYGYGGYKYDGRWKNVAKRLVEFYHLKTGQSVLDIGCGKAHLLYEMMKLVPGLKIQGIDISEYAITHTIEEIKPYLSIKSAQNLDFPDKSFDLVLSINTLHNLYIYDLIKAVKDVERIGKQSYIVVESYRNEEEKANMLYWQLTCECFFKVKEWEWIYKQCGYNGEYGFIFFE
jgi:Methylase involved in ubiquinone/menaquinone biosynthesis